MQDYFYEVNLESFGYREIEETADLLKAYLESDIKPLAGLKVCFNANSGNVFLSDEDYNVWMLVNGKLEEFFNCGNCGCEGFIEDFKDRTVDDCADCVELYKRVKEESV
jgi:hypothetical protein